MGLKKFIDPRKIKKTVDPGIGKVGSKAPDLPVEFLESRENTEKDLKNVVDDVYELSLVVSNEIAENIQAIFQLNKEDPVFSNYYEMVSKNHFNPKTLIDNPQARPAIVYSANAIKAAERDVYRRLHDPKAPFLGDLFNMLCDVGTTQYIIKRVWDGMLFANTVYDEYDHRNRLTRLAIFKERQYLEELRQRNQYIAKTKIARLSERFIDGIARKVIYEAHSNTPKDAIKNINKLLKTIRQIRLLLRMYQLLNTENWERFVQIVQEHTYDCMIATVRRTLSAQCYSILGGIQNNVLDFTNELEHFLPAGEITGYVGDLKELRVQVDGALFENLKKVEDDLVAKEAALMRSKEGRSLMLDNAIKNDKTKQLMFALGKIQDFLETFKSELLVGQGQIISDEISKLKSYVSKGLDDYTKRVTYTKPRSTLLPAPTEQVRVIVTEPEATP